MTEADLASIHSELNAMCFDGVLPTPTFEYGLCRDPELKGDYMACYYADSVGKGTIFLNPKHCRTLASARVSMAHEMIHQWQDLCGLRLDHRAVFHAWCQHITQLTGLKP